MSMVEKVARAMHASLVESQAADQAAYLQGLWDRVHERENFYRMARAGITAMRSGITSAMLAAAREPAGVIEDGAGPDRAARIWRAMVDAAVKG